MLLLLGERWEQAVPLIQTLALINIFSALSYSSSYLLLALGKVRVQAYLTWLRVGLMVFLLIAVFPEAGAQGIANIRLAATAIGFMLFVYLVLHYAPVCPIERLYRTQLASIIIDRGDGALLEYYSEIRFSGFVVAGNFVRRFWCCSLYMLDSCSVEDFWMLRRRRNVLTRAVTYQRSDCQLDAL